MNDIQDLILVCSREESGIWEILQELSVSRGISKADAYSLIKKEIDFILDHDDIFLIRSSRCYDDDTSQVMDKKSLLSLTLSDVEFHEDGPFYYLSNMPGI